MTPEKKSLLSLFLFTLVFSAFSLQAMDSEPAAQSFAVAGVADTQLEGKDPSVASDDYDGELFESDGNESQNASDKAAKPDAQSESSEEEVVDTAQAVLNTNDGDSAPESAESHNGEQGVAGRVDKDVQPVNDGEGEGEGPSMPPSSSDRVSHEEAAQPGDAHGEDGDSGFESDGSRDEEQDMQPNNEGIVDEAQGAPSDNPEVVDEDWGQKGLDWLSEVEGTAPNTTTNSREDILGSEESVQTAHSDLSTHSSSATSFATAPLGEESRPSSAPPIVEGSRSPSILPISQGKKTPPATPVKEPRKLPSVSATETIEAPRPTDSTPIPVNLKQHALKKHRTLARASLGGACACASTVFMHDVLKLVEIARVRSGALAGTEAQELPLMKRLRILVTELATKPLRNKAYARARVSFVVALLAASGLTLL
jgi:hypothetical protein